MNKRQVVTRLVANFSQAIRDELDERWEKWRVDFSQIEVHGTVGALMARQVSLAVQLASSPPSWNVHIAPLILRAMADVYITLTWILMLPIERSRKYILYGLGQEKLELEHKKAYWVSQGKNPEEDKKIEFTEMWINSQRFTFLTEVNVGSWSDIPIRVMAEEIGRNDIYNLEYAPFSANTHSMWNHVAKYNLVYCSNPLHGFHRVPIDPNLQMEPSYLWLAARYVKDTFESFDKTFGVKVEAKSGFDVLVNEMKAIQEQVEDHHQPLSFLSKTWHFTTDFFKHLSEK